MKHRNKIRFFLTSTPTEIKERLLEIGVSPKHIKNHLFKYFYILDKIYCYDVFIKSDDGVARLCSELLDSILGERYYPQIISNLLEIEMIQHITNHSTTYHKCNGYVLTERRGAKLYTYNKKDGKFISKLIIDKKSRIQTDTLIKTRLFRALERLEYDHINRDNLSDDEIKFLTRLEDHLFQIEGERGKRIYNNFTNLPKTIRKELKLNGEPLVFVDIVNSQLVFLSEIIKERLVDIDQSSNDFFELTYNGIIYEQLVILTGLSRDKVKETMMMMINGGKCNSNPIRMVLKRHYPQVLETIDLIKKDDKNVLSHMMSKRESEILFDALYYIPYELDVLYSIPYELDVLTIHDSIYSSQSNLKIIRNALIRTFQKYNIQATININDEIKISTLKDVRQYDLEEIINKK